MFQDDITGVDANIYFYKDGKQDFNPMINIEYEIRVELLNIKNPPRDFQYFRFCHLNFRGNLGTKINIADTDQYNTYDKYYPILRLESKITFRRPEKFKVSGWFNYLKSEPLIQTNLNFNSKIVNVISDQLIDVIFNCNVFPSQIPVPSKAITFYTTYDINQIPKEYQSFLKGGFTFYLDVFDENNVLLLSCQSYNLNYFSMKFNFSSKYLGHQYYYSFRPSTEVITEFGRIRFIPLTLSYFFLYKFIKKK